MLEGLKFHHIGVATRNIEKELKVFQNLGYTIRDEIFEDPIQKIKGLFIEAPGQPCMELLEGLNDDNPLKNHILKGNKFYHVAYETKNIEEDLKKCVEIMRAKVIVPITVATYFKKICFMVLPNMMIVELVQLKEQK
jgi:hypothetical protein